VSVARIDLQASRFEITANAGAKLLAPGTELPVSTCSYFAQVAEGRAFHDEDFDDAVQRAVEGLGGSSERAMVDPAPPADSRPSEWVSK
jgi:hypothetical protein